MHFQSFQWNLRNINAVYKPRRKVMTMSRGNDTRPETGRCRNAQVKRRCKLAIGGGFICFGDEWCAFNIMRKNISAPTLHPSDRGDREWTRDQQIEVCGKNVDEWSPLRIRINMITRRAYYNHIITNYLLLSWLCNFREIRIHKYRSWLIYPTIWLANFSVNVFY